LNNGQIRVLLADYPMF